MLKMVNMGQTINRKKATLKYEQEGRFCLGVAKIEINNGTVTGKLCLVFEYTDKKIVIIDAYKKEIIKKFARVRQLTLSSSQWIKKQIQKRYGSTNL